jgi:hypothetical protein
MSTPAVQPTVGFIGLGYLRSPSDAATVVRALTGLPGVDQVVDNTAKAS